jgi:hypothetical protein
MMKGNWFGWVAVIALTGVSAAPSVEAQTRVAPSPAAFECVAADVVGVKAADSQTAVGIVCRELGLASGQVGRYRVALRPLGYSVVLEVERLDAPEHGTVMLASIEEVATAAPRLAQAIVRHEPLVKTQRVDNLLADETRENPLKAGKVGWGLGALGMEVTGSSTREGGGFSLFVVYSTPDIEVPAELRVAGGGGSAYRDGTRLVAFDVGARWTPSKKDVSPFVGGGLGWLSLKVDDAVSGEEWSPKATYSGAALYVEGGVEMLRLHRARILLSVRADLPLQKVVRPADSYDDYSALPVRRVDIPGHSFYAVPVTVGMSVAF